MSEAEWYCCQVMHGWMTHCQSAIPVVLIELNVPWLMLPLPITWAFGQECNQSVPLIGLGLKLGLDVSVTDRYSP